MSNHRQSGGVRVHKNGADFSVWAPFADSVAIMGDFNDWNDSNIQLTRDEQGYWSQAVPNAKIGQEYKYVLWHGGNKLLRNDPRALQLTTSGDNSVIVDPHFNWEGDIFRLGPANQQVIYELHIGTFNRTDAATSGTFDTATQKLDYLADLGVTVIELMPAAVTPTDKWWGYTPSYIFAVESAYGGRHAFMRFVREAHKRGIGVILDVVYNHLSTDELDLWQFDGWSENGKGGIYFYNDWRAVTPWGDTRFDYGRFEVQQYITDNVRMWMHDCRVDGLRVDSTHYIRNVMGRNNDPSTDIPEGWQVLQHITSIARDADSSALLIAEDIANNDYITKPAKEGGAGFTAQWETPLPYVLRDILNTPEDNYRNLSGIRDALTKTYNGDPFQKVIYSESHDADANGRARLNEEISPGDGDSVFARKRSAIAAAIVLTAPGIPMLFQGQEFMQDGYFNHWQALDWHKTAEFHGTILLYQHLIALRLNRYGHTGGLQGQACIILHCDESSKVLAYHRKGYGGPGDDVVVAINFTNQVRKDYQIKFPSNGTWKVRLNSDWQGYSSDFTNMECGDVVVSDSTGKINLAPYSVLILSQDK